MVEAGKPGHAERDEQDPGEGEQPEQDDGGQLVVEGDPGEEAVQLEEERAVGSGRVAPELVDRSGVGVVPELEGPVEVGVHVPADHLALRRVRVDVPAEERSDDQHRQGPQPEDPHQLVDRDARAPSVEADHRPPDPHEEQEPAVDRGEGEVEPPTAGSGRGRFAEEPDARHLELERRARQRGADAHPQHGDEPEECGTEDEAPRLRSAAGRRGGPAFGGGTGEKIAHVAEEGRARPGGLPVIRVPLPSRPAEWHRRGHDHCCSAAPVRSDDMG